MDNRPKITYLLATYQLRDSLTTVGMVTAVGSIDSPESAAIPALV